MLRFDVQRTNAPPPVSVVFVDTEVEGYADLLAALPAGSEVHLLTSGEDGLVQMAEVVPDTSVQQQALTISKQDACQGRRVRRVDHALEMRIPQSALVVANELGENLLQFVPQFVIRGAYLSPERMNRAPEHTTVFCLHGLLFLAEFAEASPDALQW